MIFGSVCSGIEAASVAWHPLGWQAAWLSEIEKFPSAVLAHHYPNVCNLGDMTQIHKSEVFNDSDIDVLVGGTPCQSFSVAGLRGGLDDDRGNLALQFCKLARETRARWLVWENVPGVLSSDGGRDFGAIIGAMVQLGYGVCWRVLDAQYVRVQSHAWAVPQRRRRVFVVGYLGDWRSVAAVLFESESLSGNPAPRREAGAQVAASLTRGADSAGKGGYAGRRQEDDVNLAVTALTADGVGTCGADDNQAQGGHLVAYPLKGKGNDSHDESHDTYVAHTLKGEGHDASEDGTGRGVPLTLAVRGRGDHRQLEYRADGTANAVLTPNGGRDGIGVGAVAFAQNQRNEVREMEVSGALAAEPGTKQQTYLRQMTAVRRLTPREAERLQGFPDDYTLIPYRGKPVSKCPDGPRYRALGNSMAVNVMSWIGQRIQACEYSLGHGDTTAAAG